MKGNCLSGGNNKFLNFPAKMEDGRGFSEWYSEGILNKSIRDKYNIRKNWQYRQFLQNHSNEIIEANQLLSCDECSTCPYYSPNTEPTYNNTKFISDSELNIPDPYGFNNSDLKSAYLSRQELQSRMTTPILSQDLLLSLKRAK